jgi:integrase
MRGSVFQPIKGKGKPWAYVHDKERGEDGKRRQQWKRGFSTKGAAQAALTKELKALDDGTYVEPSTVTLAAYLTDEWLPAIEATVRSTTFAMYSSIVRTHIVPRLGPRRLQGLTGGHLNRFYRELEQAGSAPASRRLVHAVLHRALHDAVRWDKLTRNPAERADPPVASSQRATAWTAKELNRFLGAVEGDRLFALWRVAATTGARRGEILGTTWRSLDLEAGMFTVTQQLRPDGAFGPPKTKRSARTIALDADTVAALERHRKAQIVERALAGDAYLDAHDLVFADELGNPIPPHRLSEAFARHRKAAGIPTGSLHTLRHTAATLALTNGIPVHVVAARLGDRAETLLAVYAHLLPSSDEQAAERMAALLPS